MTAQYPSTIALQEKLKHSPYVLAPMAGITNAPFRLLMRELGADIVISELISSTGMQYGGQKTLDLCKFFEAERPVGLQIFGDTLEHLCFATKKIEEMGADFVDLNLGCPVPKVVSKGGGAAMLRDPKKLYDTLSKMRESISIPLTIKIRTGWDSCSINALENIHAAHEAGIAWVAIHGRTRAQAYEGLADWDLIQKIKEASPLPIIGNGDILSAEQAIHRLKTSKCDGVMIGRGALRDPFLFREIAKLEKRKILSEDWTYWDLISRHLKLLQTSYTDFYVGVQFRKFLTWYSAGIEGASQLRKALYDPANQETQKVLELAEAFFHPKDGRVVEKQRSFLNEPFLQGGHG